MQIITKNIISFSSLAGMDCYDTVQAVIYIYIHTRTRTHTHTHIYIYIYAHPVSQVRELP